MSEIIASWERFGSTRILRVRPAEARYAYFSMVRNPSYLVDSENTMVFHPLYVDEAWRRQGIATELVGAAARLAITAGVTELRGQVESQHTLRIFAGLFGEERLSYCDRDPYKRALVELPLTAPQAIRSLERAEAYELEPDSREIGFVTSIDVTGVDVTAMPNPRMVHNLQW